MLKKIYPTDGSDKPQNLNPLGEYANKNQNKLNEIAKLVHLNIEKDLKSEHFSGIVVGLKIYDYLIQAVKESSVAFFSEYVIESGTRINGLCSNIRVKAKLYETLNNCLNTYTIDQLSVFVKEILKMVKFNSRKQKQDYNFKIRALGMYFMLKMFRKMQGYFFDEIRSLFYCILFNLSINLKEKKKGKKKEKGEKKSIELKDIKVFQPIKDFKEIINSQITEEHIISMSFECIKQIGSETNSNSIIQVVTTVFKYLDEKSRLWRHYRFLKEIFSHILSMKYGNELLQRIFGYTMDKSVKEKTVISNVVYQLLKLTYKKKKDSKFKFKSLTVLEESEMIKSIVDLFIIHKEKKDLCDSLLKVIKIIAKNSENSINSVEYILKKKECIKNLFLLKSISIFGVECKMKDQLGSYYPENIFTRVLDYSVNPNVSSQGRIYLLSVIENIGTGEKQKEKRRKRTNSSKKRKRSHSRSSRPSQEILSKLSSNQHSRLQYYLYKNLLLKDNVSENFVVVLMILINHLRNGYAFQLSMIFHLHELHEKDRFQLSQPHKSSINSFICAYFFVLAKFLNNSELMKYIDNVILLKIKGNQINKNFVKIIDHSFSQKGVEKDSLSEIFIYMDYLVNTESLFDLQTIKLYLLKMNPMLKDKISESFSGSIQTDTIKNFDDGDSEDWKMFVVEEDMEEERPENNVLKFISLNTLEKKDVDYSNSFEINLDKIIKFSKESMKYSVDLQTNIESVSELLPKHQDDHFTELEDYFEGAELQNFTTFDVIPRKRFYPV